MLQSASDMRADVKKDKERERVCVCVFVVVERRMVGREMKQRETTMN